jgi:hypothetical protein
VTLPVTNNMMQKLNKFYYLFEDNNRLESGGARVPLCSKGEVTFYYYPTKGSHKIYIATDTMMTKTNTIDSLEINVKSAVDYSLKATYSIENRSGSTLYGNSLRVKFTVTNTGEKRYTDFIQAMV